MKIKRFAAALTAVALCAGGALADGIPADLAGYTVASGTVSYVTCSDVTAPYSGILEPFDLKAGDEVGEGQTLFTLRMAEVTAPEDGTVTAVFAEPGDSAADLLARYGCFASMEGDDRLRVQATFAGAANKAENREVHVGETLEIKLASGSTKGEGKVIAVSGENYVLELTKGGFDVRDTVYLYRGEADRSANRVGSGRVAVRDPIPLTGQGRVAEVRVAPGDRVRKGDVLFTLLGVDADRGASASAVSPAAGVVAVVAVQPGQQVWKGALLARVWHTDRREVVAEVDEMDLGGLRVGDRVPVTLDMNEDRVLDGVVTRISGLGVTRQNAAYYEVHIAIDTAAAPFGASASVYLK